MGSGSKQYMAKLGFGFRPILELVVKFELKEGETRDYPTGFTMEPGEVVADGKDTVAILLYMHRSDADDPEEAMTEVRYKEMAWELGTVAEGWQIEEDREYREPGKKRFLARSKPPLLHKPESPSSIELKVRVVVIIPVKEGAQETEQEFSTSLTAFPCYLFSKLWVVPSQLRHHSEAGAVILIHPNKGQSAVPLPGVSMELAIQALVPGEPSLSLASQTPSIQVSDKDGQCRWLMQYANLSWSQLAQATFKVKCRLQDAKECVSFKISVGENLMAFLAGFQAAVPSLDLTNPEWQHSDSLLRNMADWLWADFTLGLINNAKALVGGSWQYVCFSSGGRITEWAVNRRFGLSFRPTSLDMNGIELSFYNYNPIHVFFGFQLSGQDPFSKETHCLDPWWRQTVDDNVVVMLDQQAWFLKMVVVYAISYAALLLVIFRGILLRFFPSSTAMIEAIRTCCTKGFNVTHTVIASGTFATSLCYLFNLGVAGGDGNGHEWFTDDYLRYKQYKADWMTGFVSDLGSRPGRVDVTEAW